MHGISHVKTEINIPPPPQGDADLKHFTSYLTVTTDEATNINFIMPITIWINTGTTFRPG